MLNVFPDLLTFSMLAPFIVRVVAGFTFLNTGILKLSREKGRWLISLEVLKISRASVVLKILAVIEIVGGVLLIVGAWTQLAALILTLFTAAAFFIEYKDPSILKRNLPFYLLLLSITLSLLFSGAGAFAFDLPL
ncbi:MAG: DoxX family protein [Patescibacteria group bacterium]